MAILYNKYSPIIPPRSESRIPPESLDYYQQRGFLAQPKLNGTHSIIYVPPSNQVDGDQIPSRPFARGRHNNNEHLLWNFSDESAKIFRDLPDDKWYVFDAELLHSKVKGGPKDTNYIFDILVYQGINLIGTTYLQRYSTMLKIWNPHDVDDHPHHYILNERTWVARNFTDNFSDRFNALINSYPELEGFMLKDPNGVYRVGKPANWMIRCRRPHGNYRY